MKDPCVTSCGQTLKRSKDGALVLEEPAMSLATIELNNLTRKMGLN